jgi:hypothetical protein
VSDLGKNAQELKGHLVSVEGLIDKMQDDPTHCIINFLSGNTMARAYVLKGTNNLPFHFKEGDFVRMKCVYSPRFDRDGNLSILELWVNSPADIEVIGSLKTDARFDIPITLSERYWRIRRRAPRFGWRASCAATNRATGSPFGMPRDKSWFRANKASRCGSGIESKPLAILI